MDTPKNILGFPIYDRTVKQIGDKCSFVVAGPYGTGKSTLLGSMQDVGKTLLVATLQREANSWKYKELAVDTIILVDDWKPEAGRFTATALKDFVTLAEGLLDDEVYDCVAIDSGTELAESAWHAALAAQGKYSSPAEMEDAKSRWLPYEALDNKLDQAIKAIVALTSIDAAKRPKHIGISWHTQPPKDDTIVQGETKVSADHKGEGIEYEGNVLPMVRGRFRRRLGSLVDAVVFSDVTFELTGEGKYSEVAKGMRPVFKIQVQPDQQRHTKLPGPLPAVKHVPNSFIELVKLIEAGTTRVAPTPVKQVFAKKSSPTN